MTDNRARFEVTVILQAAGEGSIEFLDSRSWILENKRSPLATGMEGRDEPNPSDLQYERGEKSMTAYNLAAGPIKFEGARVLLVHTDPRGNSPAFLGIPV
jgi:hypothetical protein